MQIVAAACSYWLETLKQASFQRVSTRKTYIFDLYGGAVHSESELKLGPRCRYAILYHYVSRHFTLGVFSGQIAASFRSRGSKGAFSASVTVDRGICLNGMRPDFRGT